MIFKKLTNVFQLIASNLTENQVPYTLIGALALGRIEKYVKNVFAVTNKPGSFGL